MGKSAPSPPPPPDYAGAARAQGAASEAAARIQSQLNNPNTIGPGGQQLWQTFDQAGFDQATSDWEAGGGTGPAPNALDFYTSDRPGERPLLTQTLSPTQQALYEQTERTQGLLGGVGEQGATAVGEVIGRNLDLSGAPPAPGAPGQIRDDVVNAIMSRVQPDYERAVDQKRSDLIAGGIPVTSTAYGTEMDLLNRGLNDARQQAILAGTSAAAQDFGQTQARRKDAIAEALLQRQTPLNEINALMSGSQIQNPFAYPAVAPAAAPMPAPVFAATNAAGQYGTDVYNAQAQARANAQQGLFGLGQAGLMAYGLRR